MKRTKRVAMSVLPAAAAACVLVAQPSAAVQASVQETGSLRVGPSPAQPTFVPTKKRPPIAKKEPPRAEKRQPGSATKDGVGIRNPFFPE
jgi:hypothetical protein